MPVVVKCSCMLARALTAAGRTNNPGRRAQALPTTAEPPRAAEGAEVCASRRAAVSSAFRPAVVERFGAFCDAFVGVVREVCRDRDRDALLHLSLIHI